MRNARVMLLRATAGGEIDRIDRVNRFPLRDCEQATPGG